MHGGLLRFVHGPLAVEVLLGAQFLVEQLLGAVGVLLHALQVGLGFGDGALHGGDIVVGSLQAGLRGGGIGFGGSQVGLLRVDIGGGLGILDFGQQLALADAVAFLDQQFRDIAHGVGADVDVILGLNFARSGHLAGQILAHDSARLHGDYAAFAVYRAGVDAGAGHHEGHKSEDDLPLSFHNKLRFLVSPR